MILSKLFLPEGRKWRVKRNEDKKAGKKRGKRQEEICQILAYAHASK